MFILDFKNKIKFKTIYGFFFFDKLKYINKNIWLFLRIKIIYKAETS